MEDHCNNGQVCMTLLSIYYRDQSLLIGGGGLENGKITGTD